MTTLDAAMMTEQPRRRSAFLPLAFAAMAVGGFVAVSLALNAAAHLALGSAGLAEDQYGQCAEFVVTAALAMFVVRKTLDLAKAPYDGRVVFALFAAISVLSMAFALSSGVMKVDFVISLLQMSMLCLFAYLQFWRRDGGAGSQHRSIDP